MRLSVMPRMGPDYAGRLLGWLKRAPGERVKVGEA